MVSIALLTMTEIQLGIYPIQIESNFEGPYLLKSFIGIDDIEKGLIRSRWLTSRLKKIPHMKRLPIFENRFVVECYGGIPNGSCIESHLSQYQAFTQ